MTNHQENEKQVLFTCQLKKKPMQLCVEIVGDCKQYQQKKQKTTSK